LVPTELDGAIVTNDFWAFDVNSRLAEPRFLDLYFGTRQFVQACQRESEGTTNRVRLQPSRFLGIHVPLPPLPEQRRVVARIEELFAKIEEVRSLKRTIDHDAHKMLLSAFRAVIAGTGYRPMAEVAPIMRRRMDIQPEGGYPELGIRSFGKGTFHKPNLTGMEIGTKKLFRIEPGDLIFNNVFAWEGAVAVVKPSDAGRFGSHRFITCKAKQAIVTPGFLCFYFLTEEGLRKLGEASPGGAGRNRTLGLDPLGRIQVPVPEYKKQVWFDALQAKANVLRSVQAETAAELDALMPSIISKAFRGEL
jgi:type I restriction enzyme S subunit